MRSLLTRAALAAACLLASGAAQAQTVVRRHGLDQPAYTIELEPHLTLGAASPPGVGTGSGGGIGFRGSVPLWPEGLFDRARDSAGIGFGLDFVHYRGIGGTVFGTCVETRPGPAGTTICTRVDTPGGPTNYTFVPVVFQWNLWLTPELSLLAEPGLDLFLVNGGVGAGPALFVGGRYRVSDAVSVTLRVGWPTISIGGSFFL